jgi:hypothetical protein
MSLPDRIDEIYYAIVSAGHGDLAYTNDLAHAGIIIDGLMMSRLHAEREDYWVRDKAGNEYYWCDQWRTVFSATCFEGRAA